MQIRETGRIFCGSTRCGRGEGFVPSDQPISIHGHDCPLIVAGKKSDLSMGSYYWWEEEYTTSRRSQGVGSPPCYGGSKNFRKTTLGASRAREVPHPRIRT